MNSNRVKRTESEEYQWVSLEQGLIGTSGPSKDLLAPARGMLQKDDSNSQNYMDVNETTGKVSESSL